jgi:two-component system sensor histidine kinase QseC
LRRLSAAVAATEPHALQPIAYSGPAELVPLVSALNRLLQRIAALLDSERRFTADAAHELRTPIAAIRAHAQVAAAATGNQERRSALEATLSGCDRAARLVEQLLMLARLDAAGEGRLACVDLSAVTREVIAAHASQALAKKQTIEVDAALPCVVRGDEVLLALLVRNLVDNAIRYSPKAATVHLRVAQQGERVTLCVEDSGPGLSAEHLARLGERFYRPAGSDERGSGLGWSIVKRIAAAHRAVLEVAASPSLGGLRVVVSWPRAPKLPLG